LCLHQYDVCYQRCLSGAGPASNQKELLRADSSLNNSADLNSSSSTNTNAHAYEPLGMVEITECREVRTGAEPCYDDGDQETQMQQSD
jgi:hypothetical protein